MYNPNTVRAEMARRKLSIERLAAESGISASTIHNLLKPDGNPRAATIAAIAKVMGLKVGVFFDAHSQYSA